GQADADAAARQLVGAEELVEAGGQGGHVGDLARADDPCGERLPLDLEQPRPVAAVRDPRGGDLRRAELHAHELAARSGAEAPALLAPFRGRLLVAAVRLLGPAHEVGEADLLLEVHAAPASDLRLPTADWSSNCDMPPRSSSWSSWSGRLVRENAASTVIT